LTKASGLDFPQSQEIFLSSKGHRPTLCPSQLPIQWMCGALSPRVMHAMDNANVPLDSQIPMDRAARVCSCPLISI